MKKFITVCTLLFLLSSTNINFADTVEKMPQKNTKSLNSTIQIFSMSSAGFGRCSGVLIESNYEVNSILTAKHCINIDEEMYVEDKLVNLIIASKDDDLALLIVKGSFLNKKPIKIAEKSPAINTIGYHLGYPDGTLYQDNGPLKRITKDWEFYEMEALPGCSGGPIFNENEELIGILWGGLVSETTTLAEPLKDIKTFLNEVKLYTKWLNL